MEFVMFKVRIEVTADLHAISRLIALQWRRSNPAVGWMNVDLT
ncbi:hypothetical protein [Bradyrhizobium sp. AUGA SZCCT0222]|nr:hypothetical protein [Bradyrhizobium sp. AUGA SZCCT0222]